MAIVVNLLQLYFFILLARIVLSWFPIGDQGIMASISRFLFAITEPVLAPLRAILPPVRMGGMALDLSPLVLLIGLQILMSLLAS